MLKNPTLISHAQALAITLHGNQVDKAGKPYIGHLMRAVQGLITRWPDATDTEIEATLYDLGVSLEAIEVVRAVTRPPGTDYLDWIADLACNAPISALRVKIADNMDNTAPERIAGLPATHATMARVARYKAARKLLETMLDARSKTETPARLLADLPAPRSSEP